MTLKRINGRDPGCTYQKPRLTTAAAPIIMRATGESLDHFASPDDLAGGEVSAVPPPVVALLPPDVLAVVSEFVAEADAALALN